MKVLKRSIIAIIMFTLICGVIYPLGVMGISQGLFKEKSNGSLIEIDGKIYGSELLAQQFTEDKYLWGRIMNIDTSTFKDNDGNSVMYAVPSNLSPTSKEFEELVKERVTKLQEADKTKANVKIPVDLVTCSGSGLDPEISVEAAEYQVDRIAKERGMTTEEVRDIMVKYTKNKTLGIFGEDRVNVLKVNLALDGILK